MTPQATGALGVAAEHIKAGRLAEAEHALREALSRDPQETALIQMLALLRRRLGDAREAEALLRRAVALEPDSVEHRVRLGQLLSAAGDDAGAVEHFRQAVALMPSLAPAHGDLGNALHRLGRHDEAVAAHRRALAIAPGHPAYLVNLAAALQALGALDEALETCRQALARAPDLFHAHLNIGTILEQLSRPGEAAIHYRRAHELAPRDARALTNLGNIAFAEGRADDAVTLQHQALALDPELGPAHANLGAALLPLDRAEEAETALRQAVRLRPDLADVHKNLGIALEHQGRFGEALAAFDRAIAIDPDGAEAHVARAMARLRAGDFAAGWAEYEWRWRTREALAHRRELDRPQWRGEEIAGSTILLHAEQGLGDTVQSLRYAPLVAARGARVILEVQAPLLRLCAGLPGVAEVIAADTTLPAHDLHCPLLSLPQAFATRLDSIPAATPYIEADPEAVRTWKTRLAGRKELKVGLVWAGNRDFRDDRRRSIPPAALAPLLAASGAAFYSLQVGDAARGAALGASVEWLGAGFRDFADTAACLQALDLVITVDTAVAHLAGALGKAAWLLLPLVSDWRWLMDRTDSPWYPSFRLFRQDRTRDWRSVVDRATAELAVNARSGKD